MSTYTTKGFTGQYADAVTGLDYYNARYYDPAVGVFLSADTAQGNTVGMNPYAYVCGNPETLGDQTGKMYAPLPGSGGGGSGGGSPGTGQQYDPTPPPTDSCTENNCGVVLNHHHYSLADLKNSVIERRNFLIDFYAQLDPGYGNAEIAFFNYLLNCQRLTRSGYWNTVDFDVMRDQLLEAYDDLHDHTAQSTQVTGWLTFLAHPSSSSWWAAHNGSIDAGDRLARADGLFAKESFIEQHFINETIHVLSTVQSLSDKGIGYFSPQSTGTATLTSWFYPQQYNDSSTAFSLIKQAGAALVIGETTGSVLGGPLGGFAGEVIGLGTFFSFL
jgi:RHS repeat-associated protein